MPIKHSWIPLEQLQTAVLFLVFNRPDTTKQVFEAIRRAKPPRLYLAADGPRDSREGEAGRVAKVREVIAEVDWPCEVNTLFREKNLGCKYAVSGAITWFFEHEEKGIILEDDCLPSQSFFWYCEELLEKYKDDGSVYLISGDARGSEAVGMQADYGFCKYPLIWGWASWRRVWSVYDVHLNEWGRDRGLSINASIDHKPTKDFWCKAFRDTQNGKIDTWDYQFVYLLLANKGRCIVPRCNLISNIGFGVDATHCTNGSSLYANRKISDISLPLKHSPSLTDEIKINYFFDRNVYFVKSAFERIVKKVKSFKFIVLNS